MRNGTRFAACLFTVLLLLASLLTSLACRGEQADLTVTQSRSAGPPGPPGPVSVVSRHPPSRQETMIDVNKSALTTSGESLRVTGSGFMPGEPVVLLLKIDKNLSIVLVSSHGERQVVADQRGGFSVTYNVSDVPPSVRTRATGNRTIVAMGSDGSRVTFSIEVLDGPLDSHDDRNQGDSSSRPEARLGRL